MAFVTWRQNELICFLEPKAIREDIEHGIDRAPRFLAGMMALIHDGEGYGIQEATVPILAQQAIDWMYHGAPKPKWVAELQAHWRVRLTEVFARDCSDRDTLERWGQGKVEYVAPDRSLPFGAKWLEVLEEELGSSLPGGEEPLRGET